MNYTGQWGGELLYTRGGFLFIGLLPCLVRRTAGTSASGWAQRSGHLTLPVLKEALGNTAISVLIYFSNIESRLFSFNYGIVLSLIGQDGMVLN